MGSWEQYFRNQGVENVGVTVALHGQRLFKGAPHYNFHLKSTYDGSQGFLQQKSWFLVKRGKKIHDHFLSSLRPLEFYRLFTPLYVNDFCYYWLASLQMKNFKRATKNHFQ